MSKIQFTSSKRLGNPVKVSIAQLCHVCQGESNMRLIMVSFTQRTESVGTLKCAKPVTPVAWVLPCGRADGDSFLYYSQSHWQNTHTTQSYIHN